MDILAINMQPDQLNADKAAEELTFQLAMPYTFTFGLV